MNRNTFRVLCVVISIILSMSVLSACSTKTEKSETVQTTASDPIQQLTEDEKELYDILMSRVIQDRFKVPQSVRIVEIQDRVDNGYVRGPDGSYEDATPFESWDVFGACVYLTLSATNEFGATVNTIIALDYSSSKNPSIYEFEDSYDVTLMRISDAEESIGHLNKAIKYYWESKGL